MAPSSVRRCIRKQQVKPTARAQASVILHLIQGKVKYSHTLMLMYPNGTLIYTNASPRILCKVKHHSALKSSDTKALHETQTNSVLLGMVAPHRTPIKAFNGEETPIETSVLSHGCRSGTPKFSVGQAMRPKFSLLVQQLQSAGQSPKHDVCGALTLLTLGLYFLLFQNLYGIVRK